MGVAVNTHDYGANGAADPVANGLDGTPPRVTARDLFLEILYAAVDLLPQPLFLVLDFDVNELSLGLEAVKLAEGTVNGGLIP
jgi:hypothetical protein